MKIPAVLFATLLSTQVLGAPTPPTTGRINTEAVRQMMILRKKVLRLERGLIRSLKGQEATRVRIKKLRSLLKLQTKEKELSKKRLDRLKLFVTELESRKETLNNRIEDQRVQVRSYLMRLRSSLHRVPGQLPLSRYEELEAPKRRVLSKLVNRSLKQLEVLRADLDDAERLEEQIAVERQQLSNLYADLVEQERMLRFHRRLEAGILQRKYQERLDQLEDYGRLKESQLAVETLMKDLQDRVAFEQSNEQKRQASVSLFGGEFPKFKGRLPLPVKGNIVSRFGKSVDPSSRLQVFKKGIEIKAMGQTPVRAIFAGRVVYTGKLKRYGNVNILDHGGSYYSLVARLGKLTKKMGDMVTAGEVLGMSTTKPVYFEIRSRNVPLNPLPWLAQ